MSETGSIVDRLYTSYLLRDFVAKVVPGFLILVALLLSLGHQPPLPPSIFDISFWGGSFSTGLSFLVGFLVQAIGELLGWTRIYADGSSRNKDARRAAIKRMIEVARSREPAIAQQRERYVVLKEMSGNFSLAIVIGIVLLVSARLPSPVPGLVRFVLISLSLASFLWYNRMQADDQRTLEEIAAPLAEEAKPLASARRGRGRRKAGA